MARAKNPGKLVAKPASAVETVPDSGEVSDFPDAMRFINSLSSSGGGIEWDLRVYKIENAGRGVREARPFLFNVELEDLPQLESQLAELYPGGGMFWVQCRADGILKKNIKLEISARPGWKPPPPAYLQPVQVPVAETQSTDRMELFFTRFAQMQQESAAQTREMIAALVANNKPAPAPSLTEQIQLFTQMSALLPKGAQESTMAMFEKGMTFATQIFEARGGGNDGSETNWLDVVKEALASPLVKDMLAGMATAAQQAQPSQSQQQPPALVSPANPAAANAIDTLIRQAQAGVDPKMVAGQVANNMPPALMDELEAQEDVTEYLIAKFPAVRAHKPWFDALVAEIWEEDQTAAAAPTLADPNAGLNHPVKS